MELFLEGFEKKSQTAQDAVTLTSTVAALLGCSANKVHAFVQGTHLPDE